VIGGNGTKSDDDLGLLGQGIRQDIFQFADFVAAQGQAALIFAFYKNARSAQIITEIFRFLPGSGKEPQGIYAGDCSTCEFQPPYGFVTSIVYQIASQLECNYSGKTNRTFVC
jgi:hypothetical protein